jgi:hypothetical protein
MDFYLFNLTNKPFFVKDESPKHVELVIYPNDFATLPMSRNNFILSSVDSEVTLVDRASASFEIAPQYVKPKLSRRSRWSNISTPEDCPWRIYRDQVPSSVPLLRLTLKMLTKNSVGI